MTVLAMPRTVTTAERPARVAVWVGTIAALFLGLVLLFAAYAKAIDPDGFREQIVKEGLAGAVPAGPLALVALFLETSLGVALVLNLRRLWVLVPTTLLVGFFVLLTARSYWLSTHGSADAMSGCGCFGNLVQRSPAAAFWQDTLMLVPAAFLAFVARQHSERPSRIRTTIAVAVGAAAVLFAWEAPNLPLDDLATRLHSGLAVETICTGGDHKVCLGEVAPDLRQGKHLVVLADLDDSGFTASVDALNAYVRGGHGESVIVLTTSTAEQQRAFFWKWAPAFPIVEAPAPLLRPLYRRLPRSFEVKDGKVTATYASLPSLPKPS
jgi:hypothetical protein